MRDQVNGPVAPERLVGALHDRDVQVADPARVGLVERWQTWREFRRTRVLCLAYGGTMPGGRVRVCDKRRGHLDSHTYEFMDRRVRYVDAVNQRRRFRRSGW